MKIKIGTLVEDVQSVRTDRFRTEAHIIARLKNGARTEDEVFKAFDLALDGNTNIEITDDLGVTKTYDGGYSPRSVQTIQDETSLASMTVTLVKGVAIETPSVVEQAVIDEIAKEVSSK